MIKHLLFLISATLFGLNAVAQNVTLEQWLQNADSQIAKNPKLVQGAKANFNVSTYGVCSNVAIAVMAGDIKGQKFQQETLFMAAYFLKLADVYRIQAIADGYPPAAFESSLQSTKSAGNSQAEFDKGVQRCAGILNNILTAAK